MNQLSYYLQRNELLSARVRNFFFERIVPKLKNYAYEDRYDASVWVAVRDLRQSFEDCVLYSMKQNVDHAKPFSGPTYDIARSKCEISWRTGLSSREVTFLRPELLLPGETAYPGSTVQGNMVIAISGLPDQWDEALSIQLWTEIWATSMISHEDMRKSMAEKDEHFLPKVYPHSS